MANGIHMFAFTLVLAGARQGMEFSCHPSFKLLTLEFFWCFIFRGLSEAGKLSVSLYARSKTEKKIQ